MLVLNKPAGCLVSSRPGERSAATLSDLVRQKYGDQARPVHRPDTEMSGLVVFAKNKGALDYLSGQFQSRSVAEIQHALVRVLAEPRSLQQKAQVRDESGRLPPSWRLELALAEDENQPGLMCVVRRKIGQESVTEVRLLENFGGYAWVECEPLNGRRHQVRVQFAAAGLPVVGDQAYDAGAPELMLSSLKRGYKSPAGGERPLVGRLALHGSRLVLKDPVTREPREFLAGLPADLSVALKQLQKYSGAKRR